jgi:hypothetical protein
MELLAAQVFDLSALSLGFELLSLDEAIFLGRLFLGFVAGTSDGSPNDSSSRATDERAISRTAGLVADDSATSCTYRSPHAGT